MTGCCYAGAHAIFDILRIASAVRLLTSRTLPAPALLAIIYAIWILVGAGLLRLPIAANVEIGWSDALFMATSAVTVTGLVVVDPGSTFTFFGEFVLMLLIQLGGMGLMTFAVIVLSSLGLQIGLSQRNYLREELGLDSIGGILELAWIIFRVVLVCEVVGTVALAIAFVPEFGLTAGLWQAAFHSVSGFNNAGFSLFADSLMGYANNASVLIPISILFIVGGIGFAVLSDLVVYRRWARFSLHTRLMLSGTAFLIVLSVCSYLMLEWNNPQTLGQFYNYYDKLLAAWFEGVTPRTAGFNSMNTAEMTDGMTLITMVMMVIGGGSTSTAGGIKVTTAFVLVLATIAFFRKTGQMGTFGYSIGLELGLKVMALLTVSLMLIISGIFLLIAIDNIDFLDAAFEVTSAFGTVGLSRGATGELSDAGRAVICAIMFLGRIGPLTLGFLLASKQPARVRYPQGSIYLG